MCSGIGRALVKKLVECGAKVVAISRTKHHLDTLVEEVPDIEAICVDISGWGITRSVIETIGYVDCLVNNAGIAKLAPFLDAEPEDFDKVFDTNVKAVLNISQVVAKGMVERGKGGSIVNISSQASKAALADHAVYSSSKAALDMLSRVMALELGPHNIRVNCLNPTVVMTEMGRLGWSDPVKSEEMLSKIPLHRFAEVDEVVNAILFLLSDKASMITGVTLPIDGGFLAC
ncbi:L-xylulose reductase-like isoform X2 [Lycorma delicatula]|uniref:L-xylulose reductase-like isoform X2 n=1 Tax=Lycorma delicatula TaxID=130591 RepID=UPI003F51A66C